MSSTSSLHIGNHVTPVYLNLYDLGGCGNACVHAVGLSFYHCAVQTHSAEYGYMGHPYEFSGLYKTSKHDSRFHLYRLRDSIEVGWTWLSEKEIDQIVFDLKRFYLGRDYHTFTKNSIHFAKYLLEQLSNDLQLKHLEPIKILQLPSYIDRGRRLTDTFDFLQVFDTEKDIAEINILYFLYMRHEGDMKEICRMLKCDTLSKLRRCIRLVEQGIRHRNLPIFIAFTTFEMKTAHEYLYILGQNASEATPNDEQLTLTDVFRQFDTITLRGRTSIDRYLNIQRNKQSPPRETLTKATDEPIGLAGIHRSSLAQGQSHNQDRTPVPSRSVSRISDCPPADVPSTAMKVEHLHMRTAIPVGTILRLQDVPNPDLPLTELRLSPADNRKSSRSLKHAHPSRKRRLPRDLEVNHELYTITAPNSLRFNHTNNASRSNDELDSSV